MAGKPQTAVNPHWEQVPYGEWIITFRRLKLEAPVKCVGYALASYADWNTGNDAFPGVHELARATGYRSNHTIVDGLKVLRDMKLIERRLRGSREGRRGNADMYYLTLTNTLRELAGVDPCQCKPKTKPSADPWAALPGSGAPPALVLHLIDLVQNECRTVAELVQITCTSCTWSCAEQVHHVHTNYERIHQRLKDLSMNASRRSQRSLGPPLARRRY